MLRSMKPGFDRDRLEALEKSAEGGQKGAQKILAKGKKKAERAAKRKKFLVPFSFSERLPKTDHTVHHHMSHLTDRRLAFHLPTWLGSEELEDDPAFQVWQVDPLHQLLTFWQDFDVQLRRHLFLCLTNQDPRNDKIRVAKDDLHSVIIMNDTIYRHKFIRVNYTTYDMRREQDSINTTTRSDILMLSEDDKKKVHPYWYARIRGLFHARVFLNIPGVPHQPQDIEFAWIRWLGVHYPHDSGWKAKRLPMVGFIAPGDGTDAFGFIDPKHIVRAAHLMPCRTQGRSDNGLGVTIVRDTEEDDQDWNYFYVGM
jgi:hypothetical protein